MFEVILLYLGFNDEHFFHQTEEATIEPKAPASVAAEAPTNQEQKEATTYGAGKIPASEHKNAID